MHILSSVLFAVSANIDNFAVGISYGLKKIKIGTISNILIALISMAGTIVSIYFGQIIFNFIPHKLSNNIGSFILIILGCWTIIKTFIKHIYSNDILENPEKADIDNSQNIDAKESIILAVALSINNMGFGIGASIAGLNIWITSLLTFAFSVTMIKAGYFLGSNFLSKTFNNSAEIISGLIVIFLGIYEIYN